jgi:Fe2+ or Zn2+ uptake regulation protein
MSTVLSTDALDRDLISRLRARGQRVTSQRLVINRMLRARNRHVTAEDVHGAVSASLPGTSLPTVYATLELFEQLELVRRVNAGGAASLFDSRTDEHHHLVCSRCGAVEDLDAPVDLAPALVAAEAAGFAPRRAALVLDGLCAACRSAEASATLGA